jgi:hypothetical protein
MKNLIKITAISSLIIIACLLFGSCGGGGSQVVTGKGDINFFVRDTGNNLLSNIQIVVRESSATGAVIETFVTTTDGHFHWISPPAGVANDFFFTFTDLNSPARFLPQTIKETPDLLTTLTVNVTMVAVVP